MSKELEEIIPDNPLDCLKTLRTSANSYCSFNNDQCEYNKKLADNIEKALKRLESIDNVNPSEALERITSEFIDGYPTGNILVGMTWEEHSAIKQALLKAQEQEKENVKYKRVLEIIFEKGVDVGYLKTCKTLEEYNDNCWNDEEDFNKKLNQEEFDLLKEMTKDE